METRPFLITSSRRRATRAQKTLLTATTLLVAALLATPASGHVRSTVDAGIRVLATSRANAGRSDWRFQDVFVLTDSFLQSQVNVHGQVGERVLADPETGTVMHAGWASNGGGVGFPCEASVPNPASGGTNFALLRSASFDRAAAAGRTLGESRDTQLQLFDRVGGKLLASTLAPRPQSFGQYSLSEWQLFGFAGRHCERLEIDAGSATAGETLLLLDGGTLRTVARIPYTGRVAYDVPDGKSLLLFPNGTTRLAKTLQLVDLNGRTRAIVRNSPLTSFLGWMENGRSFLAMTDSGQIFLVDTGNLRVRASWSTFGNQSTADWFPSPDDRYAFIVLQSELNSNFETCLLLDSAGAGRLLLNTTCGLPAGWTKTVLDDQVAWTLDGHRFALIESGDVQGSPTRLFVFDLASGAATRLSTSDGRVCFDCGSSSTFTSLPALAWQGSNELLYTSPSTGSVMALKVPHVGARTASIRLYAGQRVDIGAADSAGTKPVVTVTARSASRTVLYAIHGMSDVRTVASFLGIRSVSIENNVAVLSVDRTKTVSQLVLASLANGAPPAGFAWKSTSAAVRSTNRSQRGWEALLSPTS